MKKIVSFMLIACLALCFATTSFAEAKTGNAVVTNAAAVQGDEVTLTVSLGADTAIAAYGASLVFDKEALELVSMAKGDFCAAVNAEKAMATGFDTEDKTAGTLFTATFKVLALTGDYKVEVVFDADSTATALSEMVAMTVTGGTISVACAHEWTVEETAATCEEAGKKVSTCAKCGEVVEEEIPALGHDWKWIIDKQPTVDAEGEKHEECVNCGAVRNEGTKIEKLPAPVEDVPETGDASNVAVAGALCLAAAAAAFVLTKKRG